MTIARDDDLEDWRTRAYEALRSRADNYTDALGRMHNRRVNRNNRIYPSTPSNPFSAWSDRYIGEISHPVKTPDGISATTVVGCDDCNNYRIIELDKDSILKLIEEAIKQKKITSKDVLMVFSKIGKENGK